MNDIDPAHFYADFIKIQSMMLQKVNGFAIIGPTNTEPLIDNTNVGTWKLLLEGSPVTTDIKHGDKETIPSLPIFLTSNKELHSWLQQNEQQPPNIRTFRYYFKTPILHMNLETEQPAMSQPPQELTTHMFHRHILLHFRKIYDLHSTPLKHISSSYKPSPQDDVPELNKFSDNLTTQCPSVTDTRTNLCHLLSAIQMGAHHQRTRPPNRQLGHQVAWNRWVRGPQDGYGYSMYPTIPSNYYGTSQFTIHGTFPLSYWFDADFSENQKPIVLPYRNLAFWTGKSNLTPNNFFFSNYIANFWNVLQYCTSIKMFNFKFTIHNQATIRQCLLTQGQTSTTTWDFESSQNLILAHGDSYHL
ncbi:hypothetical protein PR048_020783 [Dryococelus australis]|uniref:Capsid protein n=1 Tax=Dryococelus australis TaxID=614101 RepID=A0ABQ9GWF7_9NEOP|nr:hypothetical protein PR048_020783 [Dryococelus australis]